MKDSAALLAQKAGCKNIDDPYGRLAVPEIRNAGSGRGISQKLPGDTYDAFRIEADEHIGPLLDGDRPLGVVPQGETRNPEDGRFLLNPPRVGKDQPGIAQQLDEIQIAERLDKAQSG